MGTTPFPEDSGAGLGQSRALKPLSLGGLELRTGCGGQGRVGEEVAQDRECTGRAHVLPGCLMEPSTHTLSCQWGGSLPPGWPQGQQAQSLPSPPRLPSHPQDQCVGAPIAELPRTPPSLWQQVPADRPSAVLIRVTCPASPSPRLALTSTCDCRGSSSGLAPHFGFWGVQSSVGAGRPSSAPCSCIQNAVALTPRD